MTTVPGLRVTLAVDTLPVTIELLSLLIEVARANDLEVVTVTTDMLSQVVDGCRDRGREIERLKGSVLHD